MNHSLFPWGKLKKCSKLLNADNLSYKNLSRLKICRDNFNPFHSLVHHGCLCTAYRYVTVISDINLNPCTGNDLIDRLSSLPYRIANLFRVNLDGDNLGRIRAYFRSRFGNGFLHAGVHDKHPCLTASCNGSFHNRSCKTVDFDVHLNGCDSFRSSCHLKVHVAKEIFQSLNVCKEYKIIVPLPSYQTA